MGSARIRTAAVHGGRIIPIAVEVDIHPGLPITSIIGLPDRRIEEAKVRIRSAIKNAGFQFPLGRITINLVPAEIRKRGTGFDLAIAAGILVAAGLVPQVPHDIWLAGEVALSGSVLPFQELPAILVEAVRQQVPALVSEGFALPERLPVSLARLRSLRDLLDRPWEHVRKEESNQSVTLARSMYVIDKIAGQSVAKRALEICLAGSHPLMLIGAAGVGKSRLAEAAVELLPDPEDRALMEIVQVRALAGETVDPDKERPYRAPHHSTSSAGLLGGGVTARPGELALAHQGVLFLDELPLFGPEALNALRQPLQERAVRLTRDGVTYEYPADCWLVSACNACPCGLAGGLGECACTAAELERYAKRVSGPLFDRFALQVRMAPVVSEEIHGPPSHLPGKDIARRIAAAHKAQMVRNAGRLNGLLKVEELSGVSRAVSEAADKALYRFGLSARGIESLLAVSRTIADLDGEADILPRHVGEATQYRRRSMVDGF